jgi:hypothetical protein
VSQTLPARGLVERLKARLSSEGRKVQRELDTSTSSRVLGALSGPMTGASFIAGVAGRRPSRTPPTPAPAHNRKTSAAISEGIPARHGSAWSGS